MTRRRMPNLSRGILAMAASSVAFSTMAALVKMAGPSLPNQELVALRSLASIVPIAALMIWKGAPLRVRRPGWLFLRGFLGYVAISSWFLSLNHLSLPDAVMIQYTSPVFVALMAPFFLKEKSRRRDRWALALAILGVVIVVRPGFGVTFQGALIGLLGAVCSAGAYLTVRKLKESDHAFMVMLAFPAVASIGSIILIAAAGLLGFQGPGAGDSTVPSEPVISSSPTADADAQEPSSTSPASGESVGIESARSTPAAPPGALAWIWPDSRQWGLIAGIALMTALGQILLTYGLHMEAAGPATVATYLAVVWSIPLGVFLFDQWPDAWMILGGVLVVVPVAILALSSRRVVPPPAGAGASRVTGEEPAA